VKTSLITKRDHAMTLIEVLVVSAVVLVLVAMLLPAMSKTSHCTYQVFCANNQRQVGLSFRVWAGDNGDKFPMEISETNGGTMEFINGPNTFRHFQVMSNELSTPSDLFCRNESDPMRVQATNFTAFGNSNLSYFVGVDASQTNPMMILSGDRNFTNVAIVKNGLLELTANEKIDWATEVHEHIGNIALADGSVRQVKTKALRDLIRHSGVFTNRLQMPVLGP